MKALSALLALASVLAFAAALESDGPPVTANVAKQNSDDVVSDSDSQKAGVIIDTKTDSAILTAAVKAGWNAQTCPNAPGFRPLGNGACTPASCAKRGAPAKFQTAKLYDVNVGFLLYSGSSNPTTIKGRSAEDCCNLCASTAGCAFWQYIPTALNVNSKIGKLKSSGGGCFLEDRKMALSCGELTISYDTSSVVDAQVQIRSGGFCNDDPKAVNDPHFTGAKGTRFDFNGLPNRAYCLLTDTRLHVNMVLRGYFDARTEGASVIANGKAVRTWIRELGVVYMDADKATHTVKFTARDGKAQERGDGFLKSLEIDGTALPRLSVGESLTAAGGLVVTFAGLEKAGAFDVDFYTLEIPGLTKMEVRLRVAHPLLQTPEDAETHINVAFSSIETTRRVHGVLGQTYRDDHTQRAYDFQKVVAMLHHPIAADAEEGKGFLDGTRDMYLVSDVLATDCSFSEFDAPEHVVAE